MMDPKRLASFRGYRDLTLGGTKPKKQYAPNLNIVRNKPNVPLNQREILNGTAKTPQKSKDRVRNANKESKFLHSSGIFSEGIGSNVRKPRSDRERYASREEGILHQIPIIKKEELNWTDRCDDMTYENLIKEDTFYGKCASMYSPVNWDGKFLTHNTKLVAIKNECNGIQKTESQNQSKFQFLNSVYSNVALNHFMKFKTETLDNPNLMIWNLPPIITGSSKYGLKKVSGGQIGKLQIRRSGRIDVIIGTTKFTLKMGPTNNGCEQLITMDEDTTSNTTKTIVLSTIKQRYICEPLWVKLVRNS